MYKKVLILFFVIFSSILLFYVSLPDYDFPKPPPDSVQSDEPADMEEPLRRAYFTNYTRAEILEWYKAQFDYSSFGNIKLPTYLLNYPPEDAFGIIRDQTRSTFLQEIVHPFRETLFINGYEPAASDDKNKIIIDGTKWRQKIIIKYVPSNMILRFTIALLSLASIYVIYLAFVPEFSFLKKILKRRRIT